MRHTLKFLMGLIGVVLSVASPPLRAADPPPQYKPLPSQGAGGPVGTFKEEKIKIGEPERLYRLVVPKRIDPQQPCPVMFAFHGLGDSKDLMPWYSKLDKLAEEKGFIIAYLNGNNRMWPLAVVLAKNDLAFFDGLYDHITGKYNVDLNRVYIIGMSNGAYFSHVIATERSDKIAGIIAHSGGLGLVGLKGINVKNKYAVMAIHGDADSIVKVEEGRKVRDAYQKAGHAVEYVEVPGLGHSWANKVEINEQIWKFMEAHYMVAK